MSRTELHHELEAVTDRLRLVRRRTELARAGMWAMVIGLGGYWLARWQPALVVPVQIVFFLGAVALLAAALRAVRQRTADVSLAVRKLEAAYPDLEARLLTAVEQQPDVWSGRLTFLQNRLLDEVARHASTHNWQSVVSNDVLTRSWRRQSAALAGIVLVTLGILLLPHTSERSQSAAARGMGDAAKPSRSDYTVDPGQTEVERNQSLLVLLRFAKSPPRDVSLHWQPVNGPSQRIEMTKSLDDPVFAGRLACVPDDGAYRLEFDGSFTPSYSVTVFDLPALAHSKLTVTPPPYSKREPQVLESAETATVIEGSSVALECRVNKTLAQVELRDEQGGQSVPLSASGEDALVYRAEWVPDRSRRWFLNLIDAEGRKNRDPIELQLDVMANRRPELKSVFPGEDRKVSALQEIPLEARVSDDFGVLSTGLVIDPAGRDTITFPLTDQLAGGESHPLSYLLALEEFALQTGEVVSFAFYADDHGPDGKPRRTLGDLFFLEVRPFEETYRQMEGGGGQSNMQGASSGAGQGLDKLIELQKQIVTATWNLSRRDPDLAEPGEQEAVATLLESQTGAHEQFEQLSEGLADAAPADRIRIIFEQMSRAIEEFTATQSTQQRSHLDEALQAARGAFQGLVRLRPTDHRLMQGGQSGGGGGGGGSASQQQLEELELNDDANRYESQKSARNPNEASQQKENLAFLNRLKELAQRQQGLNEKLKELDAELHAAQTETDREELERQLKQLRDEQQDLLQDADALRNKLEQSKNSDQTAETRKQLEQTRRQLVDASESLKEGKLGQALSSGTRAEKDLQKMQDNFRKQTSAELAEALQQLRNQAKELTETEEKAAQQLADLKEGQDKSLRQRQQRERLAETFQEQQDRLEKTLKALREAVESAEDSEPLAAKRLYEAARDAQQQKTEQALNAASQLIRQGFLPEASQVEQLAHTGLRSLRQGIDEAAESILGDELADLKRAKQELAELSQKLQQEIASGRGEKPAEEEVKTKTGEPASKGGESADADEAKTSQDSAQPGETPGSESSPAPSESAAASESPNGEGTTPSQSRGKPGLRGGPKRPSQSPQSPGPGTPQAGQSEGGQGGGPGGNGGPLTGGDYSEFVDRLRDVETLLNDPELQTDVARVREQARSIRAEFKRHSKLPNWDVVEDDVRKPLVELQKRLAEEIARRESPEALVPTDRDPVPQRYRELVRKYYERLGGGGQ